MEKDSRKPPKRAETAESKDPALIIKEAEEYDHMWPAADSRGRGDVVCIFIT